MSAVDLVTSRLTTEEGFRSLPYRDSRGFLTIGYGENLDAGWSKELASLVLTYQAQQIYNQLNAYGWASGLDDVRMSVILDIAFNTGLHGLLHFVNMLSAVGAKDWQKAHDELLDSDAARQLPARYNALAALLLSG
jgi:lysozyme